MGEFYFGKHEKLEETLNWNTKNGPEKYIDKYTEETWAEFAERADRERRDRVYPDVHEQVVVDLKAQLTQTKGDLKLAQYELVQASKQCAVLRDLLEAALSEIESRPKAPVPVVGEAGHDAHGPERFKIIVIP